LAEFFNSAYSLVKGDIEILQDTITTLATEQGTIAIRELMDEQIQSCHTDNGRMYQWRIHLRPLFRMLMEQRVARSVILEVHLETIYNVLFGHNASRFGILFNFLIDLISKWQPPLVRAEDESKDELVEICTAILAKTVECNLQGLVNETVLPVINQLQNCVNDVNQIGCSSWVLKASNHMEYIQRRLRLAKEFEKSAASEAQLSTHAELLLHEDLLEALSDEGPSPCHDNNFDDITKIRILPTMSELLSIQEDCSLFHGPSQLHLPGIQGLIDRQFRLLREDKIGPLKELIQEDLIENQQYGVVARRPSRIMTNSYTVESLLDITCSRRSGLEIHLEIQQPDSVQDMTDKERKDWWSLSQRLELGTLVYFVERGTVIFCVVSGSTIRPNPPTSKVSSKKDEDSRIAGRQDLYSNKQFAYVNLNLADPNTSDLTVVLQAFKGGMSKQCFLVEFSGVLLPSFKPTLSALQQISTTLDLPFTDLLAPTMDGPTQIRISPPLYSTKPGFVFNLKCLTLDEDDMLFSSNDAINPLELCNRSNLDEGQAQAVLNALKRSLTLIQGPPGTGKSYTGEAIVKVLLANKEKAGLGPILCVCNTNHALDQFLEHLLHDGVERIIRIGSGSKSPILGRFNLHRVTKDIEHTHSERKVAYNHNTALTNAEDEITNYLKRLKDSVIEEEVMDYIQDQAAPFFDAIFGGTTVNREDIRSYFINWIEEGSPYEDQDKGLDSLEKLSPEMLSRSERSRLCAAWVSTVTSNLENKFVSIYSSYQKTKKAYETVAREGDLRVLHDADIVGITTTGLAKNFDMLRKLGAKVLLCEEAGEVLESHMLTALLPSVEHAILIGDHFQLRPHISNYKLSAANPERLEYPLDISLFERLVQPSRLVDIKLPFDMLEIQRRMHPSISRLIRDTMYYDLKDAQNVEGYPEVVGMGKRLFWFNHNILETQPEPSPDNPTGTSKTNDFEVEMVAGLVSHLVRQGVYKRGEIAVITPYLGQLDSLRKRLQNSFQIVLEEQDMDDLRKEGFDASPQVQEQSFGSCLRLATIDNFQGEEAKIVVISLVRSNLERQCGFLKTTNRINVLLSRAKHGMYIFGNAATYETVDMWSNVMRMLAEGGNIGESLQLQCPRHKETCIEISNPDDFVRLSPEAGCRAQCLRKLNCGHVCRRKCHPAPLHKAVKCLEPCSRFREGCGHGCPKLCGEPCEKICSAILEDTTIMLPCGHTLVAPQCWQTQAPSEFFCREYVEKTIPGCGHRVSVPCCQDVTQIDFTCQAICSELLPCGHTCTDTCANCQARKKGAKAGIASHGPCAQVCNQKYSACEHSCAQKCHPGMTCPPCEMPCEVECGHSKCPKKCSEPCTPCALPCLSVCPHSQCTMPCAGPCNWVPCSKRCCYVLDCGHQCPSLCGEVCPDAKYCQTCASEKIKATVVDNFNQRKYHTIDLDTDPCIIPDCGHIMTMSSMDDQLGMHDSTILLIGSSPKPMSETPIKTCPVCKGSLRNIARYGRLVRQGLLDESTKKFISQLHAETTSLEQRLINEQAQLDCSESEQDRKSIWRAGDLYLNSELSDQLIDMNDWIGNDRYQRIIELYMDIHAYKEQVWDEERKYWAVFDVVEHSRQARGMVDETNLNSPKIQTCGLILTEILLFRCYLIALGDFFRLRPETEKVDTTLHLCFDTALERCERLIMWAKESKYVRQETEGHFFYAKLVSLSVEAGLTPLPPIMTRTKDHIAEAMALTENPSRAYLRPQLQDVRVMLDYGFRLGGFYGQVSTEQQGAILLEIANQFDSAGRWFICAQGHAFATKDYDTPKGEVKCTECGAPVDGSQHLLIGEF
ncbi:hypothetical protein M426DRAFT_268420, partial [Hypoxylon sp. CI-4A]